MVAYFFQQWIRGERENIRQINIEFDDTKETGWDSSVNEMLKTITDGIQHFVKNMYSETHWREKNRGLSLKYDQYHFALIVPRKGQATITIDGKHFEFIHYEEY